MTLTAELVGIDTRTGVLVVDDHVTFAELLAFAIDQEQDLRCVGHAPTAAAAVDAVQRLDPDVVLMDVNLPDLDGISATATLTARYPDLPVVILTAQASATEVMRAGAAGAAGFVAKDGALQDVLAALRTASRGRLVIPPALLERFTGQETVTVLPVAVSLTPREADVLHGLGLGLDPRAIAQRLGISLHTCRGHLKAVFGKLGAHSQLEAVVIATRIGLLDLQAPPPTFPAAAAEGSTAHGGGTVVDLR